MLTWPHPHSDWQSTLSHIDSVYTLLTETISRYEKILICCYDKPHKTHISSLLNKTNIEINTQVEFALTKSNDSWTRDHGPLTIFENGKPVLLDFQFNGWGNKYPADLDDQITQLTYQQGHLGTGNLKKLDLILEGGSIDTDGEGTLLTTSRCLLSPQRNPELSKQQLTQSLQTLLGIDRILWLDHGWLVGDDTDSHVDLLARFCNPTNIAYTQCNNPDDEHFLELHAMEKELRAFTTKEGEHYQLIPLPLPSAIFNDAGKRLPASYANFLIINNALLVPSYDDPADDVALNALGQCFPTREIISIPSLPLIQQCGSLHCASMQLPSGILK